MPTSRRMSTLGDSKINSRMSIAPGRADNRRASEMPRKRASMAPARKSCVRFKNENTQTNKPEHLHLQCIW
jgi:SMC interacting uncharacterized protein involved in chromosome segregation